MKTRFTHYRLAGGTYSAREIWAAKSLESVRAWIKRWRLHGVLLLELRREEGPLGEWTGYYAGGLKKEPAIRLETFMHRNNPILMGAIPGVPPDDDSFYRGTYRSGAVWNQLEAANRRN